MYTFRQMWIEARSSLWFVPSLIVVAEGVAAFALIRIDETFNLDWLNRWSRLFGAGAEGSRGMLEAIATSMITVAGVTFSITIAALAQASSQYSPLVLRNFMRDRANQVVLGAFGGIFVYCLIVLRSVRSGSDEFVPTIAVSAALLHALVGIGLLVFFVHHIASTLQASSILAGIAASAREAMQSRFPCPARRDGDASAGEEDAGFAETHPGQPVFPHRSGYVQDIDEEDIVKLAVKHGAVVRLALAVGDFATASVPVAWVLRPKDIDAGFLAPLRDTIVIGDSRTSERDLAFALRQIVDMAIKALSPGINDPTTANFCLHHLGAIMSALGPRPMPPSVWRDQGLVRLLAVPLTYEALAELAFGEIRHYAGTHPTVLKCLAEAVEVAGAGPLFSERRKAALLHQLALTEWEARGNLRPGENLDGVVARIAESRRKIVQA